MAEFSMERIFRRGFGGIADPRGRDDRMQFWIHLVLVFGPLILVQIVAQMVLTFPPIDLSGASRPDPQAAQLLAFQAMQKGMVTAAYLSIGLYAFGAALLLTATARRLHDRARSGWWALVLPCAVVAAGFDQAQRMTVVAAQMPRLIEEMAKHPPEGPSEILSFSARMQATTSGPNWLAIAASMAFLLLLIELCAPGRRAPIVSGRNPNSFDQSCQGPISPTSPMTR